MKRVTVPPYCRVGKMGNSTNDQLCAHRDATHTLPRGTHWPCRNTKGPGHGDTSLSPDTRPAATLKSVSVVLQNFAAILFVFLLLGHYTGSLSRSTFALKCKMNVLPEQGVG